jgi:cytosine/adenosine deaminase-related metal-dependent hydrolase
VGRLIEEGVTCVGEVATVGASRAALQASGLAGVWYREMISLRPREAPAVLARSLRLAAREAEAAGLRPGLFPHATYSASARLIRASRAEAIRRGLAFAVHASETREEMELFADGTGPLVRLRRLLGRAGRPARECLSPVRWLELAGGLGPRATLVHATHLSDEDLGLVAARGASVVVCPRSSRFFGEGPPEIPRLVRAGVPVGLGTDSPASGGSPSLIEEMRALARMRPSLSPRLILSAATEGGARALGLEADCGALRPGGRADVALADVPPAGDPLEALMDPATRVRGLLVAGRAAPRPPVCLPPAAEPRGS